MTTHEAYRLAEEVVNCSWLAFALFWLSSWFRTKKTVYCESLARRWSVQGIIIVGALFLWKSQFARDSLNVLFIPRTTAVAIVAAAICFLGLVLAIWARLTIGRNWSARVTLKENHELIQRGPYALVRHPIYTGLLTMALGTALLVGRGGAVVGFVLFFVAFWIKSSYEETLMMQQFPAEYAAYRQRTKRIVPFVF